MDFIDQTELIRYTAEDSGEDPLNVERVIRSLLAVITQTLREENHITLSKNFGAFVVRQKGSHERVVSFKEAPTLKQKLRNTPNKRDAD